MVDKTILLSHPRFHQKNLTEYINVLFNNGYPLPFIFNTIRSRIALHSKKEFLSVFNNSSDNFADHTPKKEFFTIPYLSTISKSFIPIIKKYGFDLAFSIPSTLNSFIKCEKDNLDLMSHQGVVYKLSCQDCDASYIGQTKRQLGTRIKEHASDNKKNGSPSVISEHRLKLRHEFAWDNVKIIDNERSYPKGLISEMVHIKKQQYVLNKHSDTDLLPTSYIPHP